MVARIESGCIKIKAAPAKFTENYNSQYEIKEWGDDNLYPQHIKNLLSNSPTGATCRLRYANFIKGRGIAGGDAVMVNRMQSLNELLSDIASDYSLFGGFALHCRYNALGEIVALRALPLETLRLGEDDDLGFFRSVIYCPDWSEEKYRNGQQITISNTMVRYRPYSDDVDITLRRMGDAVESYAGEVLYVSSRIGYPEGCTTHVTTPLSTDEGIVNTNYRNARTSFNCGGIVTYLTQSADAEDVDGERADQRFKEDLARLQGDENTGSMMAVGVASMEEAPKFTPFEATNYDAKLEKTAELTESQIYAAYKQEAFYLLKIGKIGFGGDVIKDAYNLMNINCADERGKIERVLKRLAKRMPILQSLQLDIQPLVYDVDGDLNKKEL